SSRTNHYDSTHHSSRGGGAVSASELTDSDYEGPGGGVGGGRAGSSRGGSSSASVLYLAAVSEAEQRLRERADSAAKLDSNSTRSIGGGRGTAASMREEDDSELEVDTEAEAEAEGEVAQAGAGRGLTREGTLRASSSGLASAGSGSRKAPGAAAAAAAASRSAGKSGSGSGASVPGGLNTGPLRAISLKVKEKLQSAAASTSSSSSSTTGKDAKGNLVQMEPELLDALLVQLDEARDKMESMQGRYDGMKRASRIAAHGYNVASQKFELEVNARYEAEVEMASLKRKLAEQASKLSAVTGEKKRNEDLLRRSQDVRSMVTDMERSLAMLTVERDVRMAELAQLQAAGAAGAAVAAAAAAAANGSAPAPAEKDGPPASPSASGPPMSASASSLSPALPSPSAISASGSNPLLSPLLNALPAVPAKPNNKPLPSTTGPASGATNVNDHLVHNLSTRLESVKEKYKKEIDELALERDSLLIEVEELRQSRDVFIDEAQALNARNEELSAQLTLLQKRIEFAQKQEAAKASAARLTNKQLPTPVKSPPGSSSAATATASSSSSGPSAFNFGFGNNSKHRTNNSMSSASELQSAGGHHHHQHQQQQQQQQQMDGIGAVPVVASSSNAEIARPVRVQKAEATPVVKKFKWMKASAKVAGQGIAAALPGTGLSSNANSANYNGSDRSGGNAGGMNMNGAGAGGAGGLANGHHPGLGPNGSHGGSSPAMGSSSMNGHANGSISGSSSGGGGSGGGGVGPGNGMNNGGGGGDAPADGMVVREHLFQPFNILRPIRCFACQKNMWGQSEVRCALCAQSCHSKCLQNLPTSCLKPYSGGQEVAEPTGPSMFGRDLVEQATAEGRDVPEIVEKCVAAVEASGMDYEGIYRKSGGTSQARVITQLFERGQPFDLQDMDRFNDVSAITSVLKNYFRELPDPLLTFELHEAFVRVGEMRTGAGAAQGAGAGAGAGGGGGAAEHEAKMERMAELIAQLPNVHFWTLRHLILHLHRVQSRSDENRMNARNLGVVFGPTLMRSSDPSQEFAHMGGKAMTIEFFIDNPSLFAI
ncbi:Rho-type gtpase-activating protein, partial [Tilletia horrida]